MQYAIAGWPVAGCPSESLLERITRKLRDGWKRLIDILNQPGAPKNGSNTYGYPD
ncbi:protease FtsH-inhibitory lysogeny factor CIII [Escherichia coli]|uniref:protease FtsH-inhibitory lysogeny factor CIII n=1 Tax=Escherichia coli TaxID=562 RepID=UPI00200083B2|nr:protease FtsH-inhibitory lysogeny factor CIII [Escherichia coli]EFO5566265.1 protease FtsH-inhibitory lysogeny factor CIII [Escherichia coli]MCK3661955.1 protease FtsH-inhibitory lysogeny factor CIII [Escherichia coli]HBC1012814.1 protease FtsH-inhibitory lysogeny factor CIII [Escherichia coli]HDR7047485.1 protease FtsH-inhibitory lysogeny factor CIII [Escherichia coli]